MTGANKTDRKQSTSWLKRQEERKKMEAIKLLEREIREKEEEEKRAKVEKIMARKAKLKEKERLERLSLKLSQKKLLRMKRREGRTKKIAG
ncbi:hypothetical protein PGT21_032801 [Puccinia graminis f. sp. tritici]|uniref:rRNA-processing protein n=3 Tax=Puccinia graminis f. sp. tritici TaxID=56615 RepID=E3L0S1_PUCGT|nr:uncharacterized protein PGTG_15973 [Puccinia graminis f. sp. tritici CRL 75-36-700-3]EFP90125.2 hypothetical protein PGTG_15973 [Puccinia graminis f. sp. tritici CRL 75-36-700-3]KAA1072271.1 hypothetical protein PGT21_031497 [Puccinia graminis f. sp. tritici]KAA1078290.1 hypothetical protein PGT21_032801 [Puccinia graminis f. sp. tritici]KAA1106713.1 hypothetical protein PGTUg99_012992 [Puccinia graminis f. sp. tritici]